MTTAAADRQPRADRPTGRRQPRDGVRAHAITLGFVPLIDAAPLIVASALGYFDDEGLDVRLAEQIGWGNVRDRLTYGELHASHAPLGMVPASLAGARYYEEPLVALTGLGTGGNAITIATSLAALGGDGASAPLAWRRRLGRPIRLAYVVNVATHYFALCELVRAAGLSLAHDVTLHCLPPAQMPGLLARGTIDGYCAGEPWNTVAVERGTGTIFRATTELFAAHPEKALVVPRRWRDQNGSAAGRLASATLRGCDYCNDAANAGALVEILARPEHLDLDERVIARSLNIDAWLRPGVARPRFRSFARGAATLTAAGVEWVVGELVRCGTLDANVDVAALARESIAEDADLRNNLRLTPQLV